jgi:periplasmic divalent cation tolerance protein
MPWNIIVTSLTEPAVRFFPMTDKIVILSTCANEEDAARLARALVEARVAACVNIVPSVRSFYRWKGAVEDSAECLLVIKSSRSLLDALRSVLEKAHPYELPELIALPIVDGAPNYLNWLGENLLGEEPGTE